MYEYLKGKVEIKGLNLVSIEVNGVGFRVLCSHKTSGNIQENKEEKLFIHTYVREDAIKLYGFYKEEEREIFELLISVSGIGTKLALDILSAYDIEQLVNLIKNENVELLTKVSGLGTKKAQKLILEVKDKLPALASEMDMNMREDIIMGLQSLGYSRKEILEKTKKINFNYSSIQEGIKEILSIINI